MQRLQTFRGLTMRSRIGGLLAFILCLVLVVAGIYCLAIPQQKVLNADVEVKAFHIWQHTFIECKPGDQLDIDADGNWKVEQFQPEQQVQVDPQGYLDQPKADAEYAVPDVPRGALVGRVGSRKFLVGESAHLKIRDGEGGELRLCSNTKMPRENRENQFKMNRGVLRVHVRLTRT